MSMTLRMLACSSLMGALSFQLCGADQPPSAVGSVEHYCKLDYKGARLQASTYERIGKFTDWEEEPGWDSVVVVKDFKAKSSHVAGSGASVSVEYTEYGKLNGSEFLANRGTETITFRLRKLNDVWKITSPKVSPHVSPGALIAHIEESISTEGTRSQRTWFPTLDKLKSLEAGGQ
jgi:hypothetical protein